MSKVTYFFFFITTYIFSLILSLGSFINIQNHSIFFRSLLSLGLQRDSIFWSPCSPRDSKSLNPKSNPDSLYVLNMNGGWCLLIFKKICLLLTLCWLKLCLWKISEHKVPQSIDRQLDFLPMKWHVFYQSDCNLAFYWYRVRPELSWARTD